MWVPSSEHHRQRRFVDVQTLLPYCKEHQRIVRSIRKNDASAHTLGRT